MLLSHAQSKKNKTISWWRRKIQFLLDRISYTRVNKASIIIKIVTRGILYSIKVEKFLYFKVLHSFGHFWTFILKARKHNGKLKVFSFRSSTIKERKIKLQRFFYLMSTFAEKFSSRCTYVKSFQTFHLSSAVTWNLLWNF